MGDAKWTLAAVEVGQRPPANGLGLEVSDAAKELLAQEGYDPVYGARPLKRVIQQRVQNELANAMLEGRFGEGSVVKVDAAADGFVFGGG